MRSAAMAATLAALLPLASVAAPLTLTKRAAVEAAYPEGPVVVGERLLVAEMTLDRVVSASDTALTPYWSEAGCGPTSISPLGAGELLVTCHLGGYLAIVGPDGATVDRIELDAGGERIGSPNDSQADGLGGVYVSDSGLFSRLAPATGALIYVAPDHTAHRIVTGIHYANGVAVDAAHGEVLLSEHMGGRVLAFPVTGPGALGAPREALSLETLVAAVGRLDSHTGPDGIEIYDEESFLVAIYGAASLLQVSFADGSVIARLPVGPTYSDNVARWQGGLAVVGAFTNDNAVNMGTIEFYDVAQ